METDSEQGDGDILLQSDSEQEELLATPPCSAEMLLETDSEKESGESPAKKGAGIQQNGLQLTGFSF